MRARWGNLSPTASILRRASVDMGAWAGRDPVRGYWYQVPTCVGRSSSDVLHGEMPRRFAVPNEHKAARAGACGVVACCNPIEGRCRDRYG